MAPSDPPRQKIVQTVKDYGKRLFRFIRGKVRSDEDAEDILQEVWYQLSHSVNVNEIEQMSSWLFRVARNKIIDKYRRRTPLPIPLGAPGDDEAEGAFLLKELLLADPADPETEYFREVFWQPVHRRVVPAAGGPPVRLGPLAPLRSRPGWRLHPGPGRYHPQHE